MKLKFSARDYTETAQLAEIIKKIDNLNIDYINEISDEIFQQQPFFLSVLLGYRSDILPLELDEIIKIYFLIWEYFKINIRIPTTKITVEYFEKIEDKNIRMLQIVQKESDENTKEIIYVKDLQNLKSKSLFTAVLYRFNSRPVLMKMNEETKGIILIGIKSFIECFEKLNKKGTAA